MQDAKRAGTHNPQLHRPHRGYLGDTNDDGIVDHTDLTLHAGNWQSPLTLQSAPATLLLTHRRKPRPSSSSSSS